MNFETKKITDKTVSFTSKRRKERMVYEWKPFKAIAQQRKKKRNVLTKEEKKMWEFMDNMEKANELLQICMDEKDTEEVYDEYEDLPSDFKLYVWAKCDHEKHKKPLSKEDMLMDEARRMLFQSRKSSAQAWQARKEAERAVKHNKAVHALMRHKIRKCMKFCIDV
jgi:hypothetical protein